MNAHCAQFFAICHIVLTNTFSTSRMSVLIQTTMAFLRRMPLAVFALAIAMITIDPILASFWIRVTIIVSAKLVFIVNLTFKTGKKALIRR